MLGILKGLPIILRNSGTEGGSMSDLWSAVSTGVTQFMTIVGNVGTTIITNTLFQVVFGMYVAFRAISAFRRLVRVR